MYRLLRSLPLLLLAAAFAGCGGEPPLDVEVAAGTATPAAARPDELPPGHPPVGTPAAPPLPAGHPPLPAEGAAAAPATGALMPVVAPGGEGAMALLWTAPASWVAETPANPMRRGQYRVSGPGGDAECAVFYFGPGQGGEPQANVERWASQFVTADGRPGTAVMRTREIALPAAKILVVETQGTFMAGSGIGMTPEPRPGQALLGAVVEGPDAYWFFRLIGPEATVAAEREAFDTLLHSVRRAG